MKGGFLKMNKKYIKAYCKVCEEYSSFVRHRDDSDTYICTKCGFVTCFGKYKLIRNQFGYYWRKAEDIEQRKTI